ncbi:chorismate--pyruvate lyase family protein [Sulfuriferula nivalis]|uniref:chorismate--pyruvate lyase family protein n=1 Tax=Sulfuriferula nivalis TaxID=2675298 RepID=UPI001389CA02|nr:chorismate lyase [Sulfuriferula nivalis]
MTSSVWHEYPLGAPVWLRPWLVDQGSLTQRITARCLEFSVQNVSLRRAYAYSDEFALVGRRRHSLLRDVSLCCADKPVVYAHSVLPYASMVGAWARLRRLGNRPLGAALFVNPKVYRESLQFRRLDSRHPLWSAAVRRMVEPPQSLWARRSVFVLASKQILVTEVFLPAIRYL